MPRGVARVQCKNCGEFFTGHVRSQYCSDSCKAEGENWKNHFKKELAKRNMKTIECQLCGTTFQAPTLKSKYCSDKCKAKAIRDANRERARKVHQLEVEEDRKAFEESEYVRTKPKESIAEINEKARAKGMTYGQYLAAEQAKAVRVVFPRKEVAHG